MPGKGQVRGAAHDAARVAHHLRGSRQRGRWHMLGCCSHRQLTASNVAAARHACPMRGERSSSPCPAFSHPSPDHLTHPPTWGVGAGIWLRTPTHAPTLTPRQPPFSHPSTLSHTHPPVAWRRGSCCARRRRAWPGRLSGPQRRPQHSSSWPCPPVPPACPAGEVGWVGQGGVSFKQSMSRLWVLSASITPYHPHATHACSKRAHLSERRCIQNVVDEVEQARARVADCVDGFCRVCWHAVCACK